MKVPDQAVGASSVSGASTVTTRQIVAFSGLYGMSAILLRGVGFLVLLYLARALPVEKFANFGLLYAVQTALTALSIAGIVEVVIGKLKEHRQSAREGELFAQANSLFAMLGLAVAVLALLLFAAMPSAEGWGAAIAALLLGSVLAFASLQSQVMRLQENHRVSLAYSFLVPLAGFLCGGLLFFLQHSLTAFFAGGAVGAALVTVALLAFGVGNLRAAPLSAQTWILLRACWPFLLIALFGWLSGYGNNYVVQALLKPADVAQFTFLLSLSGIIQLVATALNQAWSPRFFRLIEDMPIQEVEKQNRIAFRWLGIALGGAGAGMMLLYTPALDLMGGQLHAYRLAHSELLLMIVTYVFALPWWHAYNYYLVHSRSAELMHLSIGVGLAGILIWVVMMLLFSSAGIYLGFFVQMILRSVAIAFAARRHWPLSLAWEGCFFGSLLVLAAFALVQSGML